MDARRRLEEVRDEPEQRKVGRVWVNGVAIGGDDPRWDHLAVFHD